MCLINNSMPAMSIVHYEVDMITVERKSLPLQVMLRFPTYALIAMCAVIAAFVLLSPQVARASTITVTTSLDTSASRCTLRNAITAANNNAISGACPAGSAAGDTIVITATGTITLNTVLPTITSTMSIVGPGSANLTVRRNPTATTGSFYIFNVTSLSSLPLSISGMTVRDANSTEVHGGAMHIRAASGTGGAPTTLTDMVFRNNVAQNAGGGVDTHGAITITNCIFDSNVSGADGGGFSFNGANETGAIKIINSLFVGNRTARNFGSAISNVDNNTRLIQIINTTVTSPTIFRGSAIAMTFGTVYITNTIIASANVGISRTTATVSENYNLFYNVTTTVSSGVTGGTGDVVGDPKFISPATGNYRLGSGSAAINKGINIAAVNTDIDGDPRPLGLITDMGYDEATANGIAMDKTASAALVKPGDRITYTLTITNGGPAPAVQTVVTDTVPVQLTDLAYESSGVTITPTGASSYVFQLSDLAADAVGTIWIYGTIDVSLTEATRITNTASLATSSATSTRSASAGGVDISIPPIGLAAVNDSPAMLGSTTTLTASVEHGTNVTYSWDFGDGTEPGSGAVPTHTYTLPGIYTATVTATNNVGTLVEITVIYIDDPYNTLVGLYTANKTGAYLAEEIVYTFVLTNVGHLTHDDVIMSATLPIYTVLTGTVEGGGYVPPVLRPRGVKAAGADSGYVYWTGTMAPGESRTITYTVVVGWSIFMPGQKLMDTIGDAWLGTYLNYEQPVSVEMLPRYRVYLMNLIADNSETR